MCKNSTLPMLERYSQGRDHRPLWLVYKQEEGTGLNHITIDGNDYTYTLIRPGIIHPEFPYAVGLADNTNSLFISSNVPPEDRRPILTHEIREHIRFPHLLEEERCTAALAAELREVQLGQYPQDFKHYVDRRTNYFNALLQYYQAPQHAAGVTESFRDGLITAAGYINHISAGLNKRR